MGSEHLGRRQIMTAAGAGVLAAAGLGGTAAAAPAASSAPEGHVPGGWLITRTQAGAPGQIRTVLTFAAGGAILSLDIDPAAPPLAGSWDSDGEHGFEATFWGSVTDPQGRSVGTVRVKATGRVDGNRMSGSYTFRASVQGQNQNGSGGFHGIRIDPD